MVAAYGSVAHGAARRYSDPEVVVVTMDEVVAEETQDVRKGVVVEVGVLPATPMLSAATWASPFWGLEAEPYRVFAPLYDPSALFPQVRAASRAVPPAAFVQPLDEKAQASGGIRHVLQRGRRARRREHARCRRRYAHAAALRAALLDRRRLEISRALWADARGRGLGLDVLISARAEGPAASRPEPLLAVHGRSG